MIKEKLKGIKFKCLKCKNIVQFPPTPNIETDRFERLVFGIYTITANDGLCYECRKDLQENKKAWFENLSSYTKILKPKISWDFKPYDKIVFRIKPEYNQDIPYVKKLQFPINLKPTTKDKFIEMYKENFNLNQANPSKIIEIDKKKITILTPKGSIMHLHKDFHDVIVVRRLAKNMNKTKNE